MKVHRDNKLVRLAGCDGCRRRCLWCCPVADPDGAAQESGKSGLYKCNKFFV